ncbi:unnamed protein product [Heterobilharzia americana]|nr:unnamed protein product [Heterobilharzia americana]CAH8439217.1 unnamed protein product [Heterobilharzia americana]
MNEFYCHRIHFFEYQPSPFSCLARNDFGLIAAGRQDGSVDVYDENRDFFMVAHVPRGVCCSVESLVWIQCRLFCAGALGRLMELDLQTSSIKGSCLLVGNVAARCMTVFDNNIIVGNDEGFITFFSVEGVDPTPTITIPKLSGKILSVACTGTEKAIVATGTSTGSLLLISIRDGISKVRFTLTESKKLCFIWTLLFARGLLFSGDSRGVVSIWDISVGGQLFSFSCHHADVLALASSPDGSVIFSGGADALIRRFEFSVSENGEGHWQCSGLIRGCRRDIHAIAFIPGHHHDPSRDHSFSDNRFEPHRLVAVGQDARLQVLSCESAEMGDGAVAEAEKTLATNVGRPRRGQIGDIAYVAALPFWPASVAPTYPAPARFIALAKGSMHGAFGDQTDASRHLCLLHYQDRLCLVRLGKPLTSGRKRCFHGFCSMSLGPLQIVEIRPSRGMEFIESTLSPCGLFIAYSDFRQTRLLKLDVGFKRKRGSFCVSKSKVKLVEWQTSLQNSINLSIKSRDKKVIRLDSSGKSSSNTSSSEAETDIDEILHDDDILEYFTMDKSSSKKDSILSNDDSCDFSPTEQNKVSGITLPPSCLMTFTANSENLLLVTQKTGKFMCISVDNGNILWDRNVDQGDESCIQAHVMSVSNLVTEVGYLIALGCSDGRVRLYDSPTGSIIFTCSCVNSITGHSPLPVSIVFPSVIEQQSDTIISKLNFSVLYTNSQLREWSVSLQQPNNTNESTGSGNTTYPPAVHINVELNKWLVKFWRTMGNEISRNLGVFHSVDYIGSSKWLLASDRYLVIIIAHKNYKPGMLKKILQRDRAADQDYCMFISRSVKSILQAKVLSESEIAVISIHSENIALQLASPLQRKVFGT